MMLQLPYQSYVLELVFVVPLSVHEALQIACPMNR
jgi:hypothetical protein